MSRLAEEQRGKGLVSHEEVKCPPHSVCRSLCVCVCVCVCACVCVCWGEGGGLVGVGVGVGARLHFLTCHVILKSTQTGKR